MNRKKLISKRNQVYLVESNHTQFVEKYYENIDDYYCELLFYQEKGMNHIPQLIAFDEVKKMIKMSYIAGVSLADQLEALENQGAFEASVSLMIQLFDWMDCFHVSSVKEGVFKVMKDVNLSNFIVSENVLYGVDFEQVCIGNPLTDIAQLMVIYLNNDPQNTPFKHRVYDRLMKACLSRYRVDAVTWNRYVEMAELEMIQRRKKWKRGAL